MRYVDVINQYEQLFSPMTLIARARDAVVLCLRKVIAEVITWRCASSRVVGMCR